MIAVIGDPDTAAGFRLAGIKEVYEYLPGGGGEIIRVLEKLSRAEVAIIIINERIAADARIRAKIKEINEKKRGVRPIIIEVPDKQGPMKKELDEIGLLIKRAVGLAVK